MRFKIDVYSNPKQDNLLRENMYSLKRVNFDDVYAVSSSRCSLLLQDVNDHSFPQLSIIYKSM